METIHMCHCVSTSKHIGEKLHTKTITKVDMGNVNSANSS